MTRVTIRNLTKVFGALRAVDNLNLEIKDREFVALLGPSGCGKTTTLNCISGLETPTSGEILFDDVVVNDLPSKDRGVGLVFQTYAVFYHMTVYENIAFGLKIRKVPGNEIRKEVMQVADFLGLTGVLNRKAGTLELSGMQKTAIGRTLVTKPKVLLLDEPLSNLDAAVRTVTRAELKRMQKELEQTTIFVTHDQLEAMTLSDQIAVMDKGKLQQYDTPDGVYNRPVNRFVANFIGSPSINLVDCSLEFRDGKAYLVHSDFRIDVSNYKNHLEKYASKSEVILGIRPEHIYLARKLHEETINTTVFITEPLGGETLLNLQVGGLLLRVMAPGDVATEIGSKLAVEFDKKYLHIFDKKTQEAII